MERFRKGDRTQRYDWMEEFNRDPEHYRLEDDSFVCENTRRGGGGRRRGRGNRRICRELLELVGFVEFFVAQTVHFGDVHGPDLDNDDDEKAEEEGEGRSARTAHGAPHFLLSFHHELRSALGPVGEERHGDNNDKGDDGDHISPANILEISSSLRTYNIYTIDGRVLVERGRHEGETDERNAGNRQEEQDRLDNTEIVETLGIGEEIHDSLIRQIKEGESLFLVVRLGFRFHNLLSKSSAKFDRRLSTNKTEKFQLLCSRYPIRSFPACNTLFPSPFTVTHRW